MGKLVLPSSGYIYLDTNAFIYSVEKIAPYDDLLEPVWIGASQGTFTIISSEIALLETLVRPLKTRDSILAASFRSLLLASSEVELLPITLPILEDAARLRAVAHIKTPDAIHAATALAAGCATFITNDADYQHISGLAVQVLNKSAAISEDQNEHQ